MLPLQARRVVITSASALTQAAIIRTDSFSRRFFNRLLRKENFNDAFKNARDDINFASFPNTPQVDADGDGRFPEAEDLDTLAKLGILGDPDYYPEGDVPNITGFSPPQILARGVHRTTIEARVEGGGVVSSAIILPPGLNIPTIESWEVLEELFKKFTIPLDGDENTGYRGSYDGFMEPGKYTIFIYAENGEGTAVPVMTTVTVPCHGDANSDGIVNVLDLVMVASQFMQSGPNLSGDVNGDGKVDVLDLVCVASHFGETTPVTAAPSQAVSLNALTPRENAAIQQALAELERLPNPPHGTQDVIDLLRQWLANQVTETRLLPNYPNPFNPETWMPYQLASDAHVRITIYDLKGALVRQLELGHQTVGDYRDRRNAAYWDGRNASGEPVASGIYFYQLSAGDFTATRRMVILK